MFEVGPIFKGDNYEDQYNVVTGIRCGNKTNKNWKNTEVKFDFYDIKSDIIALLNILEFPVSRLKIYSEAPDYFHPGRSALFKLGNVIIASFGQINPVCLDAKVKKTEFLAFEIYLDNIYQFQENKSSSRRSFLNNPYQMVERDFAFMLPKEIEANEIIKKVKKIDKDKINKVTIFDVYEGDKLPNNKKSIAIRVLLQPTDKTFKDEDIENLSKQIIDQVSKSFGAIIRN